MSTEKTKIVIGSIELTSEERVLLAESIETEWKSQLDALDAALNGPEELTMDSFRAMKKRMATLRLLQKRILA